MFIIIFLKIYISNFDLTFLWFILIFEGVIEFSHDTLLVLIIWFTLHESISNFIHSILQMNFKIFIILYFILKRKWNWILAYFAVNYSFPPYIFTLESKFWANLVCFSWLKSFISKQIIANLLKDRIFSSKSIKKCIRKESNELEEISNWANNNFLFTCFIQNKISFLEE